MIIGIPKERRPNEYRVGLSPAGVKMLTERGHPCFVEDQAGRGAGFRNIEYEKAGAQIAFSAEEVFGRADLLLKMARPLQNEIEWLRPNSAVAAFLHLASAREEKLKVLREKNIYTIAYEQIQKVDGTHPVLRPLSQIGGTMAAQTAARLLQNKWGGRGILLGMIPGVPPAEVVILGAGVVGTYAARAFQGLGAHVTVLDNDMDALQRIAEDLSGIVTMVSTPYNISRATAYADVAIGAILVSGERSPILVTREMVRVMKPRSVILDVSIDQGGCFETSRPTTHDNPVYVEEEVTHYCVPNLSGVVARTATHAFVNASIPYILELAGRGIEDAVENIPALKIATTRHN